MSLRSIVAMILAYLIPGAGHFFLGQGDLFATPIGQREIGGV